MMNPSVFEVDLVLTIVAASLLLAKITAHESEALPAKSCISNTRLNLPDSNGPLISCHENAGMSNTAKLDA